MFHKVKWNMIQIMIEKKDWTATAIVRERLNGLKIDAMKGHRSVGGHLDFLLENCGIPRLSDSEYRSEINKLYKGNNKK